MKLDIDTLKKHRFWVLLGFAVPLTFLALLILALFGGTISAARKTVLDKLKSLEGVGEVKSTKWVDHAKVKAKVYKGLEEEVWKDAYFEQRSLFTWPTGLNQKYQFTTGGKFALSITATRKAKPASGGANVPPGAEPPPIENPEGQNPEVPASATKTVKGVISDIKPEWLEVRRKVKGKDSDMLLWKTKGIKVTLTTEKDAAKAVAFSDLENGDEVQVVYQIGKYFGDELTDQELTRYENTYQSQIKPIIDLVQPLQPDGTGIVQFKGWQYGKSGLPPGAAPFFKYVAGIWQRNGKSSKEAWIAQEDLWIQREIYRLIREANDYTAEFRCEGGYGNDPVIFADKEWKLNVEVTKAKKLQVTLINQRPYARKIEDLVFGIKVNNHADPKKSVTVVQLKQEKELKPNEAVTFKNHFDVPAGVVPVGVYRVQKRVSKDDWQDLSCHGGGRNNVYFFANPHWQMKVFLDSSNRLVVDRITNLNSIPQRIDVEFNVRINDDPRFPRQKQIAKFRVQNNPLNPGESAKPKDSPFTLKFAPNVKPLGIYGLTQVLTWEFAAVKRIDQIVIGSGSRGGGAVNASGGVAPPPAGAGGGPAEGGVGGGAGEAPKGGGLAHSHRTIEKGLVSFFKEEEPAAAPDGDGGGGFPMPPGGNPGGAGEIGGGGGGGGVKAPGATPNGFVYKRYVEKTPQARRLPVAVVLIVDQDQVGRVLATFTNSKLRFLTTQVLINRFPRSIRPLTLAKATSPGNVPPDAGGGLPASPGAGAGAGAGIESGAGGESGAEGGSGAGAGGYGGYPGRLAGGSVAGGGDDRVSNVELVIYGFVSLYERYPTKPALGGVAP